jgi:orotidine-5'-phosphate decarboxylase
MLRGVVTEADFLIVTPGVRPVDNEPHDQKRTMTPGQAIALGADYIVVGRPILRAADPVAAAADILREITQVASTSAPSPD